MARAAPAIQPYTPYKPRARPRSEHKAREFLREREVYFVRASTLGLIKIGVANFAAERLGTLQVGSPDKLELLGVVICANFGALEADLHARFHETRSHGEWFKPSAALLGYIARHARAPRERGEVDEANEWDEVLTADR